MPTLGFSPVTVTIPRISRTWRGPYGAVVVRQSCHTSSVKGPGLASAPCS